MTDNLLEGLTNEGRTLVDASQFEDSKSMFDRTMSIVVKRTTFGTMRKVKGLPCMKAAAAVEAEPEMTGLSKRLFVAPEFKAIIARDGDFDEWLGTVSLPSLLRAGTHAIPLPFVAKVQHEIARYASERRTLVVVLVAAWPRIVQDAAQQLGPQLFDPRNYPDAEQLAERFNVEWNWIDYGTPERLKSISQSIFAEEQQKAATQIKSVQQEAVQELRGRMLGLVSHVVERLTPGVNGKKKTFRKSMLDNMHEFLEVFPTLDAALGGDAEAQVLVQQAKGLMDGIDPELLRKEDLVRQKVAEGFEAIRLALDAMTVARGTRQFALDDDEAGALPPPDVAAAEAWQKAHEAFGSLG